MYIQLLIVVTGSILQVSNIDCILFHNLYFQWLDKLVKTKAVTSQARKYNQYFGHFWVTFRPKKVQRSFLFNLQLGITVLFYLDNNTQPVSYPLQ